MLLTLPPELFFFIYIELDITDTLSFRQASGGPPNRHGCTKALWIRLFERLFHDSLIPPSLINYTSFDAATLETLAHRISTLSRRENLPPTVSHAWRTQLPRGIQWVGLAASRWLIAASSDRQVSTLQCWDLTRAFNGDDSPVAQIYLPAQVKTAKLEVQQSGIILALGLMNPSTALYVVSLKRKSDCVVFVHEYSLIGSSHVLMLHDAFVGCAIREALNEPHIVNWKTGALLDIQPPPGGLDIPSRRSVPHLMTMWTEDTLVIVRFDALEFYRREGDRLLFLRLSKFQNEEDRIQEVTVCQHCDLAYLQLAIVAHCNIRLLTVGWDNQEIIINAVSITDFSPYELGFPIIRLGTSQSSTRIVWVSGHGWIKSGIKPSLAIFSLTKHSTSALMWKDENVHAPALWAFSIVDYDDILGLTVVGNHFGELAVYDHVGGYAKLVGSSFGAAPVLEANRTVISEALDECVISGSPFHLDIPFPVTRAMSHAELVSSRAGRWAQDNLDLDPQVWIRTNFTTDTIVTKKDRFIDYDTWEGQPGDQGWLLSHMYGLPGEIIPQAFASFHPESIDTTHVYWRNIMLFRLSPNGTNIPSSQGFSSSRLEGRLSMGKERDRGVTYDRSDFVDAPMSDSLRRTHSAPAPSAIRPPPPAALPSSLRHSESHPPPSTSAHSPQLVPPTLPSTPTTATAPPTTNPSVHTRIITFFGYGRGASRSRKQLVSLWYNLTWGFVQIVLIITMLSIGATTESKTIPGRSEFLACRSLSAWDCTYILRVCLSSSMTYWGWRRDRQAHTRANDPERPNTRHPNEPAPMPPSPGEIAAIQAALPHTVLYSRLSILSSLFTLSWFLTAHILAYSSVHTCRNSSPHIWWLTFGILCIMYLVVLEVIILGFVVFVVAPIVFLFWNVVLICLGRHPMQNPGLIRPDVGKLSQSVVDKIPLVMYIPAPPDAAPGSLPLPQAVYSYPPKAPTAQAPPRKHRFKFLRKSTKAADPTATASDKPEETEQDAPEAWEDNWERTTGYPFVMLENNRASCAICLMDFEEPKKKGESEAAPAPESSGIQEVPVEPSGPEESDGTLRLQDAGEGAQPLRLLACGHVFHAPCLDPWLTDVSGRCPVCQRPVEIPNEPGKKKGARRRRNA
ncbi:RING-type domain-containing protein [Mycena indigotica]|uniref:RING-type domain-containing protein n=1 Tax=Mycena indigotica TaxID=2126181 RepID=A0A8H6TE61_9AGAR|nr:RING-type domain-containing protein [Mycena indigotica]KAF7315741.1 RING-type domain-containing protein [Mycena indigotica]